MTLPNFPLLDSNSSRRTLEKMKLTSSLGEGSTTNEFSHASIRFASCDTAEIRSLTHTA